MPTRAASRFDDRELDQFFGVASRAALNRLGITAHHVAAQVAARRWTAFGSAVLLHNGEPDLDQRRRIVVINCGRRAVLTSFTAAEELGLRGWHRPEVHVLVPAGTRAPRDSDVVVHRCRSWPADDVLAGRRLHRLAPAAVVAAASLPSARPACGLMAAVVQQRLTDTRALRHAVGRRPRMRHRAAILLALDDIAQGARRCRRSTLRACVGAAGYRRRPDRPCGCNPTADVDVVVRTDEAIVIDQLRRFLRA